MPGRARQLAMKKSLCLKDLVNPLLLAVMLAPLVLSIYSSTFPSAPMLILEMPNRVSNLLVFGYFLAPLLGIAAGSGARRRWLALAAVFTPLSFVWLFWTWSITDDYVDPDWHLNRTIIQSEGYAVRVYDSATGSFLREERRLVGCLTLVQDRLHVSNRGLEVELVAQTRLQCKDSSGRTYMIELAGK